MNNTPNTIVYHRNTYDHNSNLCNTFLIWNKKHRHFQWVFIADILIPSWNCNHLFETCFMQYILSFHKINTQEK